MTNSKSVAMSSFEIRGVFRFNMGHTFSVKAMLKSRLRALTSAVRSARLEFSVSPCRSCKSPMA